MKNAILIIGALVVFAAVMIPILRGVDMVFDNVNSRICRDLGGSHQRVTCP